MKKLSLLLLALCSVVYGQSWTLLTNLPSTLVSNGGGAKIYGPGDGSLYSSVGIGTSPTEVNHIFVAAESCITASPSTCWKDITTSTISGSGSEGQIQSISLLSNNTVLACASNGSSTADCWTWNGNTSSPVWTIVGGWTGASSSFIYGSTNDAAGNNWFSPAYSGDLWKSAGTTPTYSKILTSVYTVTGQTPGGIYSLKNEVMNGVPDLCGGGEGELECFNLASLSTTPTWTSYLPNSGWTGNLFGCDSSANTLICLREDSAGDFVNRINKTTLATTTVTANSAAPAYPNSNAVPTIHWLNGLNWAMGNKSSSVNWVALSADDGVTFTAAPAGYCPGGTLSFPSTSTVRIAATSNYVYIPCTISGNAAISQYGPL